MDDIYFSDKKKRDIYSDSNNSGDFLETDYFDEEFELDLKKSKSKTHSLISEGKQDNKENTMHPDEFNELLDRAYNFEPDSYEESISNSEPYIPPRTVYGIDRTPHGNPVARRTNGGTHLDSYSSSPHTSGNNSPRYYQDSTSARPSSDRRTPTGQRVTSPQHAAPRRAPQTSNQAYTPKHQSPQRALPPTKKKKNSSVKAKVAAIVISLFAVVILALFGYGYSILGNLGYDDGITENRYLSSSAVSDPSIRNILFIGSDARGDVKGQRSDTMILFSIDTKHRQIKLTSFLRDSYVYIPYLDRSSKINASFSTGGAQATIDTVEYNYGVDIDNYVMIDFQSFEQIVDLLGGVTIDVTEKEAKYMREDVKIPYIKAGKNKMNGKVALWYCRIRYLDNDFKRTERQRKVISAIIKKATKTSIPDLVNLVEQVVPNISTDIERNELLSLGVNALLRYIRYDIVQQQMPADGTWRDSYVNGSYVIKFDEEENRQILREFLLNKVEKEEKKK